MGIPLSSNMDLVAALPLDSRTVKADLTERDAIPSIQRYEGMQVYVLAELKNYQLKDGITNGDWVEIGGGGAGITSINGETEASIAFGTAIDNGVQTPGFEAQGSGEIQLKFPLAGEADVTSGLISNEPQFIDGKKTLRNGLRAVESLEENDAIILDAPTYFADGILTLPEGNHFFLDSSFDGLEILVILGFPDTQTKRITLSYGGTQTKVIANGATVGSIYGGDPATEYVLNTYGGMVLVSQPTIGSWTVVGYNSGVVGGGGFPSGNPYDVIMLDTDGVTPIAAGQLRSSADGLQFVNIPDRQLWGPDGDVTEMALADFSDSTNVVVGDKGGVFGSARLKVNAPADLSYLFGRKTWMGDDTESVGIQADGDANAIFFRGSTLVEALGLTDDFGTDQDFSAGFQGLQWFAFIGASGAAGFKLPTDTIAPIGALIKIMDGGGKAGTTGNEITVDAGTGNFILQDSVGLQTCVIDQDGGVLVLQKITDTTWKVI